LSAEREREMIAKAAYYTHRIVTNTQEAYRTMEVPQFLLALSVGAVFVLFLMISLGRRRKRYVQNGMQHQRTHEAQTRWIAQSDEEWTRKRNRRRIMYVLVFVATTVIVYKFAVTWKRLSQDTIAAQRQSRQKHTPLRKEGGGSGFTASYHPSERDDDVSLVGSEGQQEVGGAIEIDDVNDGYEEDGDYDDDKVVPLESTKDGEENAPRSRLVGESVLSYIRKGPRRF